MTLRELTDRLPLLTGAAFAIGLLLLLMSMVLFRRSRGARVWIHRRQAGKRGLRAFILSILFLVTSVALCGATVFFHVIDDDSETASAPNTTTQAPSTEIVQDVTEDAPSLTLNPTISLTISATTTQTALPTGIPSQTQTPTATPTETSTPTASPTDTPTHTPSATASPTASATPSATHTGTITITSSATMTPSATLSPTSTHTSTASVTPTPTVTASATPSATPSRTLTPTATNTHTPTPSPTVTSSPTVTLTPTITPFPTLEANAIVPTPKATSRPDASLSIIAIATEIADDLQPLNPGESFPTGFERVYFFISFENMGTGVLWSWALFHDGNFIAGHPLLWGSETEGETFFFFGTNEGFATGEYELHLYIGSNAEPIETISFVVIDS